MIFKSENKMSVINKSLNAIHGFNHYNIHNIFLFYHEGLSSVAFVERELIEVCGRGRTLGRWLNIGTLR
jgi:hypothetical protein